MAPQTSASLLVRRPAHGTGLKHLPGVLLGAVVQHAPDHQCRGVVCVELVAEFVRVGQSVHVRVIEDEPRTVRSFVKGIQSGRERLPDLLVVGAVPRHHGAQPQWAGVGGAGEGMPGVVVAPVGSHEPTYAFGLPEATASATRREATSRSLVLLWLETLARKLNAACSSSLYRSMRIPMAWPIACRDARASLRWCTSWACPSATAAWAAKTCASCGACCSMSSLPVEYRLIPPMVPFSST